MAVKTEYFSVGRIHVGKLISWTDAPGVRFFFNEAPTVELNNVAMHEPIALDFASRGSFTKWFQEQTGNVRARSVA